MFYNATVPSTSARLGSLAAAVARERVDLAWLIFASLVRTVDRLCSASLATATLTAAKCASRASRDRIRLLI